MCRSKIRDRLVFLLLLILGIPISSLAQRSAEGRIGFESNAENQAAIVFLFAIPESCKSNSCNPLGSTITNSDGSFEFDSIKVSKDSTLYIYSVVGHSENAYIPFLFTKDSDPFQDPSRIRFLNGFSASTKNFGVLDPTVNLRDPKIMLESKEIDLLYQGKLRMKILDRFSALVSSQILHFGFLNESSREFSTRIPKGTWMIQLLNENQNSRVIREFKVDLSNLDDSFSSCK